MRANSKVGSKYDLKSLVWFQMVYRITGTWIGPTGEAAVNDGMECAEYVAWCHGLPKSWLYSSRELHDDALFETVFIEN
jgi:hypothetical protein